MLLIMLFSMYSYKIIRNPQEANRAWEELSNKNVIDDDWKFREEFRKYYNYDLHFIGAFDNNRLVGLLPLQFNNRSKMLEVHGGDDTDDNKVLVKPGFENQKEFLIKQLNKSAFLAPLAEPYKHVNPAEFYEYKYYLNLEGLNNYESYLEKYWHGKSKNTFRRQIRNFYRDYKIEIIENNYDDLELMFALNQQRFGNQSSFQDPIRQKIFRDFINMYQVILLTLKVNDKKEAVSYAIKYHDVYLSMNVGVNNKINGLGKLLTLIQINKAIALNCKIYDAGKGDSGWKEKFKFSKIPQYKLKIDIMD